ncbi:MAG: serine/threonine-protein kinase [Actinomycetia bacterium]|nr:serine/threonine-protein kinase [Actinomycetes bacterium]
MGEVFAGRYELLELLGQGGMGSVWLVHDRRLDRVVAAKVLRQSDAASLLRFVREQGMRVSHPHVVAPLGWAAEDSQVLFTMEVVDGGSVEVLIGDYGALPPRLVAEVLRQLLAGLQAVHAAGIVHRDIKPANVLLAATGTGRPHAFLSDFGIAVDLDGPRLTEAGVVAGTPGYLAPELVAAEETTPAVDLYAVGVLGAAMLTGLKPRQIDLQQPPPAGVPGSLWRLLRDLVIADPGLRPSVPEARSRLDLPELAWTADAIGDIEVLRQIPDRWYHATPGGPPPVAPAASETATVLRAPDVAAPPPYAPEPHPAPALPGLPAAGTQPAPEPLAPALSSEPPPPALLPGLSSRTGTTASGGPGTPVPGPPVGRVPTTRVERRPGRALLLSSLAVLVGGIMLVVAGLVL